MLEYAQKHLGVIIPKCSCGKEVRYYRWRRGPEFGKTCGNDECKRKVPRKPASEAYKEKARQSRFRYLKLRTGLTAWERRNQRKMSYLEQWFYDNVVAPHGFEVTVEKPVYPYFIDFAFEDLRLAVELDGKCHFDNGPDRIEHDRKKDRHLTDLGWSVYRIRYDEANSTSIEKFLEYRKQLLARN